MKKHRLICSLAAALLLQACGFTPMHAEPSAAARQQLASTGQMLSQIAIHTTTPQFDQRRTGQMFTYALEDRLHLHDHYHAEKHYNLQTSLEVRERPISISRDGTVSRYNMEVIANLQLLSMQNGELLYETRAYRTSSYNNEINRFYSSYVSREDAVKQSVLGLAEDVHLRLASYFAQSQQTAEIHPGTLSSHP